MISDTIFDDFLSKEINISEAQRAQGSTSHLYLRGLLANKSETDSTFPVLLDGDFLSGSYARGTKTHPLDDIDVMMVLDGSGLVVVEKGVYPNVDVRDGDLDLNPLIQHLNSDRHLGSKTVLQLFQTVLNESYPNSAVSRDGQAINVWLEAYQMGIDVVPCFHIIPRDGSQDYYYIPNGTSDDWMRTNPKLDKAISDRLHVKHNRRLKGLVKLLKYWNAEKNSSRLKPYHLETMVWHIFEGHPNAVTSYREALKYFFKNATQQLVNDCPDVTKMGGPVDKYLSAENRQKTIENISAINQKLSPLGGLLPIPIEVELSAWRYVFGDSFNN